MVDKQLLDFVSDQQEKGVPNANISSALLTQGWQQNQIQEAFNSLTTTPSLPPKRSGKKILVKIILATLLLIILLVVFAYSYLPIMGFFAKDVSPINDHDLIISPDVVPNEQNAFYVLVKLKYPSVYSSKSDFINDPKQWNDNAVKDELAKNSQLLALFDEALSKPYFQNPIFVDTGFQTPDSLGDPSKKIDPFEILKLSKVVELKAQLLLRQGKDKEALEESLKIVDLGQKMTQTQPSLIDYLTALGLKRIGLDAAQRIVTSSKLSTSDILLKIAFLEKYKSKTEGLENSFRGEYLFVKGSINYVEKEADTALKKLAEESNNRSTVKTYNKFTFQPNRSRETAYNFYKQAVTDAGLNCYVLKDYKALQTTDISPMPILMLKENSIGSILTHALISVVDVPKQIQKRCDDLVNVSVTQTLFALKAFKIDNNKLPENLTELVPKYVSTVPVDPYSNGPLLYQHSKAILYSTGVKGIDVGGSTGDDWTKMENPTFRINF